MKSFFMLALILALLCGCSAGQSEHGSAGGSEPSAVVPSTAPTETMAPTLGQTEPTVPPTQTTEPTVPTVQFYNPLTGIPMEEPSTQRIVCVMLNNSKAAMPQHGVADADILYEMLIEGETRCMGVYSDLFSTETFGAIRSARSYFLSIAQSFDALYVHAGGSDEVLDQMSAIGYDHIDGVNGANAYKYYYRDRLNQGYAYHHTLFIRPQGIWDYSAERNCRLDREGNETYGLEFDDQRVIIGQKADSVKVWFNISGGRPDSRWHKSTSFAYDPDTKLYKASQYDGDYIDGNTGEQLAFRNVLVLRAKTVDQGDADGHLSVNLLGTGSGHAFINGQMVPIQWHRERTIDPFTYTVEGSDAPLTLGTGKTYIAVIPQPATLEWE